MIVNGLLSSVPVFGSALVVVADVPLFGSVPLPVITAGGVLSVVFVFDSLILVLIEVELLTLVL